MLNPYWSGSDPAAVLAPVMSPAHQIAEADADLPENYHFKFPHSG
jgi:hypothetical protein